MLIFFYPTCFLFQFVPVHLAIRVCHCKLSLPICPLWRKAWLFDMLGCNFFSTIFSLFPHWMLSHFPLLFTYLHWFCDSIASFLIHPLVPLLELFFWTWFSVLPHAVIHLSACISARGNSHIRVYFRMRKSAKKRVFPHVFPRGNSQIRL